MNVDPRLGPGGEALDRYVDRIAAEVLGVFGDRVAGVWLLGSLAYGGFGSTSDVDVQAAVALPTDEEITALVERIRHPALPCPAVGLEFVLYDVEALRRPTPPLQWSLNLNGGPARETKVSTDPASESWHWFLLDLAIGRQTARTLHGRALREVVGPIRQEDQRAAIAESLRWHSRHEEGTSRHTGNAARGLRYLRTGEWVSKPDALGWAASLGYSHADVIAELRREGLA
jgi:hypothetical protein